MLLHLEKKYEIFIFGNFFLGGVQMTLEIYFRAKLFECTNSWYVCYMYRSTQLQIDEQTLRNASQRSATESVIQLLSCSVCKQNLNYFFDECRLPMHLEEWSFSER